MSIDISGISSSKVSTPTDDSKIKQSVEQATTKPESVNSSAADTVSLSDNAVQLGKINSSSISAPVVDTQRVEQVRQAISNGTYEIDAEKIADKLMQFETILTSYK